MRKQLQVSDVVFKEYENKVFRYDEELNSIKDKIAVNSTVEKIKNNVLNVREIEQFLNFSDLNKCSLDDQNKYLLDIVHSLLQKDKKKKEIVINQKSLKQHVNPFSQIIDLSEERNKIDLINEEIFEKNSKSFLSLNNSNKNSSKNSCIGNYLK